MDTKGNASVSLDEKMRVLLVMRDDIQLIRK